jgi:uncharacterized protein DUF928
VVIETDDHESQQAEFTDLEPAGSRRPGLARSEHLARSIERGGGATMRTAKPLAAIVVAGLIGVSGPAMSQESKQVAQATSTLSSATPVYKPPLRGAPGGRVGGGTRGTAGRDVFVLSVLAPDHQALTVSEQPTLYWYISGDTSLPVEFAIIDPNATEPLLEKALPTPVTKGIHQISLADYGVKLAPNVAYRWSVTVVPDANRRSRDILSSGIVERVATPAELTAKLTGAPKDQLPGLYAEAGMWYDALAAMSALVAGAPSDASLRQQRAALLTQAGLPEITSE